MFVLQLLKFIINKSSPSLIGKMSLDRFPKQFCSLHFYKLVLLNTPGLRSLFCPNFMFSIYPLHLTVPFFVAQLGLSLPVKYFCFLSVVLGGLPLDFCMYDVLFIHGLHLCFARCLVFSASLFLFYLLLFRSSFPTSFLVRYLP
jgi:hypothetical protein